MTARHRHAKNDNDGLDELRAGERDEVIESARSNPDPTTRRESVELELMELGRSDAGEEIGDTEAVAEEPEESERPRRP